MSSPAPSSRRIALLGYGACALASCFWGTGFYFGRIALNEMTVPWMVLYRFLFASLAMLPVAVAHRVRLNRQETRLLLISAFFGVPVQFLIQFKGLDLTTVSHASLMVGTMPVLLGVAAVLFAGERLEPLGWAALFASTAGASLIVLGGHHASRHAGGPSGGPSLAGDLLVVLSLITALVWVLVSKKLLLTRSAPVVSAYTILAGTAMLAAWVLGRWVFELLLAHPARARGLAPPPLLHVSLVAWGALAAGGFACTAATTFLWNWGIHRVPASRAGVLLNIEPLLGSYLGVRLLGEHLGPFAWLGGALILGAAITLTTRGHQPQPELILE
ncbi:MAG TPA: EamA family transporter [Terracidiphilus sp.]|nr:EamA family transporter [Terracidiphilus sp.]